MPLPDKIANKPILRDGLGFYFKAFTELNSDRALGMAEGPIRWTAVNQYGYRHRIFDDEFDRLVEIIKNMDEAYLKFRAKKEKKKIGKSKGGLNKPKTKAR